MKFFITLCLIIIFKINYFICQIIINTNNTNNINYENNSIQNAVYIIKIRNETENLEFDEYNSPIFLNDEEKPLKLKFLITKDISKNTNNNYYYIQESKLKYKIGLTNMDKIKAIFSKTNRDSDLWNIIPKINSDNNLIYYVQNKKNKRFWEYNSKGINKLILSETTNVNNLTINNEFIFIKLYRKSEKINTQLLNNEPIDVLIKYIDLSDPNLIREGIPQIQKDFDNKELKYSIRSILKNIPWIRKIFILMPNEKVSFLKSPEEIKEKIIYVKDKDLLGFDSASSPSFQFNLHKMKKFGISENFILMDDDCFIGKPLNKTDFFYEENGKVYPCLITSDYYEMDRFDLEEKLDFFLSELDNNSSSHSPEAFNIQHSRSLLLMYDIFGDDNIRHGKKLIEPAYTHNAIPVKLSDIEEIHDFIIKYYPFANDTLSALFRSINSLQMQTTYMAYVKNQYDRKVSIISSTFYDLTHLRIIPYNKKKLFVINTGTNYYRHYLYTYERKNLNKFFPNKTKYELNNDTDDIELNDLLHTEYYIYHTVYSYIEYYINKKIKKIDRKIKESFMNINNKIYNAKNLIRKEEKKNIEKAFESILSEEINYLKNENKNIERIKYYLICFIIFIGILKLYLIFLKKKNIEKIDKIDIVL